MENKEMQGVLFPNDKQGNEKRPDLKGHITIKGVTFNISAWSRTSQNGRSYMSIAAEEPRQQPKTECYKPQQLTEQPGDLPF